VARQRRALQAFAEACGWEATEFVDLGPGTAADRRLGLEAPLAAVRNHEIGTIVSTSVDRLIRSSLAELIDEFGPAKLIVLWSAPHFDCSPWGRKMRREAPWANTGGRQTADVSSARSSSGRQSSGS